MMRRLPAKFGAESLLQVLDQIAKGSYDFVYVPHDKRKDRNLSLAFMNFVDHETAQKAFEFFRNVQHPSMGPSVRVSQADIQGLGNNLAYFLARFGLQEMNNPHAPMIFENGARCENILEAVKQHVSLELLVQAHSRMEVQLQKKTVTKRSAQRGGERTSQNRGRQALAPDAAQVCAPGSAVPCEKTSLNTGQMVIDPGDVAGDLDSSSQFFFQEEDGRVSFFL
ncbi:unnamed protein product [Effrenium voratum]|uniref:Mei2-like C-terminal RNA recognition motif domain-containing protein n=1 Tax=Effrenium voratum TaxID=2562239 RepID=A0AA36HMA4_9DINO|nr:unnamed protein product [Effrenium voratum]CAJ1421111.1 unnamed protein product [Effrenium voratum]